MQEHLIPQDISNYKFHLIGELDLKQFGEVMAGVIIAVIINAMGWPSIIKWPLMITSVGVGLLAAFVPLGGQPLSHWIKVFIKALFSPTKFYWRKETVVPSYFTYELPARNREFLDANSTFNDTPARKHKALMYFSTLDRGTNDDDDPLERFTDASVAKATEDFTYAPAPVVDNIVAPKKMISKPMVGNEQSVRQRQILTPTQESLDAFLETSSIFQPAQIMEEITAVDAKMANSDSTLAAALDDGTTPTNLLNVNAVNQLTGSPSNVEDEQIAIGSDNASGGVYMPDLSSPILEATSPNISEAVFSSPTPSDPLTPAITNPSTLDSSVILPDLSTENYSSPALGKGDQLVKASGEVFSNTSVSTPLTSPGVPEINPAITMPTGSEVILPTIDTPFAGTEPAITTPTTNESSPALGEITPSNTVEEITVTPNPISPTLLTSITEPATFTQVSLEPAPDTAVTPTVSPITATPPADFPAPVSIDTPANIVASGEIFEPITPVTIEPVTPVAATPAPPNPPLIISQ